MPSRASSVHISQLFSHTLSSSLQELSTIILVETMITGHYLSKQSFYFPFGEDEVQIIDLI